MIENGHVIGPIFARVPDHAVQRQTAVNAMLHLRGLAVESEQRYEIGLAILSFRIRVILVLFFATRRSPVHRHLSDPTLATGGAMGTARRRIGDASTQWLLDLLDDRNNSDLSLF